MLFFTAKNAIIHNYCSLSNLNVQRCILFLINDIIDKIDLFLYMLHIGKNRMIPYCIQYAIPTDDIRDNNIHTEYGYVEKEKLTQRFIQIIIEFMNDFCCEEIGHNIKITSYKDFCEQYWNIGVFIVRGWYFIFNVYYFEEEWIEWNVENYQDQIYNEYVNKYIYKIYIQ